MKKTSRWMALLLPAAMLTAACGHSDEEMAAKQREVDRLSQDLRAAQTQMKTDQENYQKALGDLERLRDQLKQAGSDTAKLQQALSEYQQRAQQLEAIEKRFRELRSKLDKLNSIGLKVVVRNNRMVIQLPGDILFDSGKDDLKPQAKEVLGQVAEVIRSDKDLMSRYFLVAGHTDNVKYGGGPFKDNWGLSLARSRQVLLFLVGENKDAKPAAGAKPDAKPAATGGGLSPQRWAAAGYGETDPAEGTVAAQNKDQQNKNRRIELVVQPNVEEMINLGAIK